MPLCNNVLDTGRCDVQGCRAEHAIIRCACGVIVKIVNHEAHLRGRRHRDQLRNGTASETAPPQTSSTRCDICMLNFVSWGEYEQHRRTQAHQDAVAQAVLQDSSQFSQRPSRVTGTPAAPGYIQCDICRKDIHVDVWVAHTTRHTSHQQRAAISAALEEAEKDKNGVVVSYKNGIDFGIIDPAEANGLHPDLRRTADVKVNNTSASSKVVLHSIRLSSSTRGDHYGMKFSAALLGPGKGIKTSPPRTVSVTFHPSYEGQYEDTMELTFHRVMPGVQAGEQFVITRRIRAIVGSPEDHELLRPKSEYVKPKGRKTYQEPKRIVRVVRPVTWSRTKWVVPLPEFKPPSDVIDAAFGPRSRTAIKEYIPPLSLSSHAHFFQALLWVEEEYNRRELARYDMINVPLIPRYPNYELTVKGLAEKRPSVIVGDIVLVKHAMDHTDTWYEGCVHVIELSKCLLRFNKAFTGHRGMKVDVRFVLNRLPDRRMHQAVVTPNNPPRFLFPTAGHSRNLRKPGSADIQNLALIDRSLASNQEQLETIAAIVNRPPGSVPFVIFGPPGTGKTATTAEAVLQIVTTNSAATILACAPTNSAADEIAKRLIKTLRPSELFRLNAYSRSYEQLKEDSPVLLDYSLFNDNGVFAIPPLDILLSYRVVVCTLVSAGILHGIGVRRGHFSHIFVDEAGQATEPMSMIPIKTLANDLANVVLAGDPQQLEAPARSPLARAMGLKLSYLERLMELPLYDEDTGKGLTVVKLVNNFRSHPDILAFPNTEFYRGELLSRADPVVTHSLVTYDKLPKKNFPIIFHGVVGKDQREASSPSFFNIDEVTLARRYALDVLETRKLRPHHIGIIAPYHAQCQKILAALPDKLKGVKVGSVEEFQGQERRVIIITTVRSSTEYLEYDMRHTLGFVADRRRLNVAITRAQSLLIVVGNPHTLGLDPMWRAWLNFVRQKGGWRGKEPNWNPAEHLVEEGYDAQARTEAEADAEEMIKRMRAQWLPNLALNDEDESEQDPREYPGLDAD